MRLLSVVHEACADPRLQRHLAETRQTGHDVSVLASALVLFPYTSSERTHELAPHHTNRLLAIRSAAALLEFPPEAAKRFLASVEDDPLARQALTEHCLRVLPDNDPVLLAV